LIRHRCRNGTTGESRGEAQAEVTNFSDNLRRRRSILGHASTLAKRVPKTTCTCPLIGNVTAAIRNVDEVDTCVYEKRYFFRQWFMQMS
jgi:hypothetical protein